MPPLTVTRLLRYMHDGCVIMRSTDGKYTLYDGTDWMGLVTEKVVSEAIADGSVVARNIPGAFGAVEYTLRKREKVYQRRLFKT